MQRDETSRASLDYQHVYDYCAGSMQHHTVLLISDHDRHTYELGRRLTNYRLNDVSQTEPVNAVLWVEPRSMDRLDHIRDLLSPSGELYVITANPLARRLPEWGGVSSLTSLTVCRQLQKGQLKVRTVQGFHSLTSILWGYLSLGLRRLEYYAASDRCWYAMRATFTVNGWQAHLAPVAVIRAEK